MLKSKSPLYGIKQMCLFYTSKVKHNFLANNIIYNSYSLVKKVKKVVSSANIGWCSLPVTMPGVRLCAVTTGAGSCCHHPSLSAHQTLSSSLAPGQATREHGAPGSHQ